MAWVLTKGLQRFRSEINAVFPERDKSSDGSVGDLAHQGGASGHNPDRTGNAEYRDGDSLDEVRAVDITQRLVPGSAVDWMERLVQFIVLMARAGTYVPFRYIIYKGRIWARSDGWRTRTYTGQNRHDRHAHFSGDYSQKADNWDGTLGLASLRSPVIPREGDEMFAKLGDENDKVIYLQYRLNNLGHPVGIVDGRYQTKTAAALAAAIRGYNGQVIDGKTYGPAQMIYLDVLWARRYGGGRDGQDGRDGTNGLNGRDGVDGKDGTFSGVLEITGGRLTAAPVEG